MRLFAKTVGWLVVSGTIIFVSNLIGGSDVWTAAYGAMLGKIGTTVAYFFYEYGFERFHQVKRSAARCEWHGEDETCLVCHGVE